MSGRALLEEDNISSVKQCLYLPTVYLPRKTGAKHSYILWIRLYYILHGLEKVVYLVKYLYMEQF